MKPSGAFITMILCLELQAFAAVDTASTGNWTSTSTWNSNTAPSSGDTLVIPYGVTVTVNCNCGPYANMHIVVYGVLHLPDGRKISMTSNGIIDIYPNGTISGESNGDKLVIGSNVVWTGAGSYINGPTTCDSTGCGSNEVLPIELTYFRGGIKKERVVLEWSTAAEINNDYFSIWRSDDLNTWEVIGTVTGSGHSSSQLEYKFHDNQPLAAPAAYYLLEQTDFNGTNTFVSEALRLQYRPNWELTFHIFPNPAKDVVYLMMDHSAELRSISVMNLSGYPCLYLTPSSNPENLYEIDIQSLPPGAYILQMTSSESEAHQVFMVE